MSRLFYHVMQDNVGNLLFDVSGTMRLAGSGTLATIYGDEALTVIVPNPMTNHPSFGSFKCFLGAGDYDFYMAKAGYTFETLTGVQGHGTMAQQDANAVAITGGTATLSGLLSANGGVTTTNLNASSATLSGPLSAGSATLNGVLDVVGTSRLQSAVGIGVVPNPSYTLSTNPGAVLFGGMVGVQGIVPSAGLTASTALISTITCNGSAAKPGNGPWGDTCSRQYKTAIAPIVGALALLLAQQGRQFEWTREPHKTLLPGPQYGFVQEEVTIPQWQEVTVDGERLTTPRGFDALCIEALREIVQRLEAIEARQA